MNLLKPIQFELKAHWPFTLLGAASGIILMMLFRGMEHETAHTLFRIFHPGHVVFSAIVTTSMFRRYTSDQRGALYFCKVLLIGYIGSIGIGTLSDSLIPFLGETLLELPHREAHIGFIEHWWLVNPLAIGAVIFAYFLPRTHLSHTAHVMLSTWASLFHMMMALDPTATTPYFGIFLFLFLAVWIPCGVSDIAFPLLFIPEDRRATKCYHS
jgi:hypothetical protein